MTTFEEAHRYFHAVLTGQPTGKVTVASDSAIDFELFLTTVVVASLQHVLGDSPSVDDVVAFIEEVVTCDEETPPIARYNIYDVIHAITNNEPCRHMTAEQVTGTMFLLAEYIAGATGYSQDVADKILTVAFNAAVEEKNRMEART